VTELYGYVNVDDSEFGIRSELVAKVISNGKTRLVGEHPGRLWGKKVVKSSKRTLLLNSNYICWWNCRRSLERRGERRAALQQQATAWDVRFESYSRMIAETRGGEGEDKVQSNFALP